MKCNAWLIASVLMVTSACTPSRPVVDTGARPPNVGGTIAGTVSVTEEKAPLPGRMVTAIDEQSNATFRTTTGSNGGYTLKVPAGRYRLDIELRPGESLAERPDPTDVAVGDIDSARNFVVTRASRGETPAQRPVSRAD
jgi:hypothetical protein